jgi:hypothetical protein
MRITIVMRQSPTPVENAHYRGVCIDEMIHTATVELIYGEITNTLATRHVSNVRVSAEARAVRGPRTCPVRPGHARGWGAPTGALPTPPASGTAWHCRVTRPVQPTDDADEGAA